MAKNQNNSDEQYTKEATFGTLPVRKSERQYGMLDAFLVLSGYGVATWCYTQGTFQAAYCDFKQLLTTTFAANIFILALYLLPVLFATKYGVDMWQWLKSTFGTKGAGIVALVLTAVNFPWFGQCAEIFANTIDNLFKMAGHTPPAFLHKPMGLLCILLGTVVAIAGPLVIKWANRIIVPLLLLVGVAVCVVAFNSVPLSEIFAYKPDLSFLGKNSNSAYAIACEAGLAFGMSWCASTAVTPRLCKKEKDGYWATVGAYGVVAPFFVMAGGVLGIATFVKTGVMGNDITEMLVTLSSPGMALTTLALVIFANIATQGTGSYMWAVVLKSTFPKVKFNTIAIVLGIYAGVMVIWGQLLDYIGSRIVCSVHIRSFCIFRFLCYCCFCRRILRIYRCRNCGHTKCQCCHHCYKYIPFLHIYYLLFYFPTPKSSAETISNNFFQIIALLKQNTVTMRLLSNFRNLYWHFL